VLWIIGQSKFLQLRSTHEPPRPSRPVRLRFKTSPGIPDDESPDLLRAAALIAAVVGGLGSVVLMLIAAQHPPLLLLILFVLWVLAPFAALAWASIKSMRWTVLIRATICYLTLVITLLSLTIYVYRVLNPPKSTGAFIFVAVPGASWLLVIIVVAIAALISRRRSRITQKQQPRA
jgi:hypothetical protein